MSQPHGEDLRVVGEVHELMDASRIVEKKDVARLDFECPVPGNRLKPLELGPCRVVVPDEDRVVALYERLKG